MAVFTGSSQSPSTETTSMSIHQSESHSKISPVNAAKSAGTCQIGTLTSLSNQTAAGNIGIALQGHYSCLTAALIILEALSVQNLSITRQSLGHTLRLNKNALARCRRLTRCEICSATSSFVMLLIVLCQNMTSSYERIMVLLIQQYREIHSPHSTDEADSSNDTDTSMTPLESRVEANGPSARSLGNDLLESTAYMKIYGYEIDMEEQPAVFGAIARLQLQTLQKLLFQTRAQVDGRHWTSHVVLVDSAVNRINVLLDMYVKCPLSCD